MTTVNSIRLSPSAISTFNSCQRRFFHKFVQKLPEKLTPHKIRGTIVHKALEKFFSSIDIMKVKPDGHWHEHWENFRKIMFDIFEEEWGKIGTEGEYKDCFADGKEKETFRNESKEFLDFFTVKLAYSLYNKFNELDRDSEWFEANLKKHFFPKDRELRIELLDENIIGFIDKTLNLFGKGVAIVDYKTSKTSLPHFITESDLKQCKAYAYLWNKKFGELPKFISIFYVRDGESVYYPISEKDVEEIENDIKTIRGKKLEKQEFLMNPTRLCEYCDFFKLCYNSKEEYEGKIKAKWG